MQAKEMKRFLIAVVVLLALVAPVRLVMNKSKQLNARTQAQLALRHGQRSRLALGLGIRVNSAEANTEDGYGGNMFDGGDQTEFGASGSTMSMDNHYGVDGIFDGGVAAADESVGGGANDGSGGGTAAGTSSGNGGDSPGHEGGGN